MVIDSLVVGEIEEVDGAGGDGAEGWWGVSERLRLPEGGGGR